MPTLSRRDAIRLLAAPIGLAAIGVAPSGLTMNPYPTRAPRLKVLVVGGHPDDPESGCGGTIARYAEAGHAVTVLYLTRGEAGIDGKSHDEAARIRSRSASATRPSRTRARSRTSGIPGTSGWPASAGRSTGANSPRRSSGTTGGRRFRFRGECHAGRAPSPSGFPPRRLRSPPTPGLATVRHLRRWRAGGSPPKRTCVSSSCPVGRVRLS